MKKKRNAPKRAMAGGIAAVIAALCIGTSASASPVSTPGADNVGDHWFPTYGNGGYHSIHYDLDLAYDAKTKALDGTTRLTAQATQNLSRFSLDLDGMNVSGIRVDGQQAAFSRDGHKLTITPAHNLRKNERFDVSVKYDGVPKPMGLGPTETGFLPTNDGAFTVTNDVASDTWFPNNDHPLDKASYRFRIQVPNDLVAVANGRLTSTENHGNSKTFTWDEPSPMASYLTTVDIGKWQIKSGTTPGGVPEYVAVDPQLNKTDPNHPDPLSFFYDTTAQVTDEWTQKFGPYPFVSTGAIADYTNINGQPAGFSEETQTRPVYGSVLDPIDIAHELAHQWFGDSVSLTDFDDIWLNEGFATWAAWYWDGEHGGTPVDQKVRQEYDSTPADSSFWTRPVTPAVRNVSDPNSGARVYNGGAMALQFLREKVGDQTFFQILRTWTAEHRDGHATTAQFVELAEKVSGKDLGQFFQQWIYGTGKPALAQ